MNVNERLAKALGWWREPQPSDWWAHATETNAIWAGPLPDYESSLDALVRDVVPVLRAQGWEQGRWSAWDNFQGETSWFVEITRSSLIGSPSEICKVRPTMAAALANAAAQALEGKDG